MQELRNFVIQQVRREQPPVYVPLRLITSPISWNLAKIGLSPHVATGLGVAAALAAAANLATAQPGAQATACLFIIAAYLCDCMDGEVARARGVASAIGSQLDQFANWVTLIALQIGLALGATSQTGDIRMPIWGMFAVAGWCTFYYLYLQIAQWLPAEGGYAGLRALSRLLFWLMPLDENIVLGFAAIGRLEIGVIVSTLTGTALSFVVCAAYLAYRLRE